ncbi:uncharacterized protein LOC129913874 isoform X3 [Episyrphus balteatus]|uniref:uncharacterized protein LOC129913874 isoform X3 n=1 Tax=Episyrphus balteatus TaxID=286459 RepID=UPI00248635EE|nr:uncharacterized protein LOC129913874 isoform X3 [Episyrphus balteatus]
MDDTAAATKKNSPPTLSIDRAAFLLLRVKKAFKKKRQQRKDRQQQQQAALANQTRTCRKQPPPLLRSRTLPAIVVPGISIIAAQTETNRIQNDKPHGSTSSHRWSLLPKPRGSVVCDDSNLEYRRKSSSSSQGGISLGALSNVDPYSYNCEDFECQPDGSVVLRIPAPHIVAARAYRVSTGSNTSATSQAAKKNLCPLNLHHHQQQLPTHHHHHQQNQQQQQHQQHLLTSNRSKQQQDETSGGGGFSRDREGGIGSIGPSSTNTALCRLVKLLNQTTKATMSNSDGHFSMMEAADPPRRLSWERRDTLTGKIPRSASIDSVADAVWCDSPRPSLTVPRHFPFQHRPSSSSLLSNISTGSGIQHPSQLNVDLGSNRRESVLSPSSTRRNKLTRIINDHVLPDLLSKSCCEKSSLASNSRHSQPTFLTQDGHDFQLPTIRPQRSKRHLDFTSKKKSTKDCSKQSAAYDFYTETSPLFNKIPGQLNHHHHPSTCQFEMDFLVPHPLDHHHHQQQQQQQHLTKQSRMKNDTNKFFVSRYPQENHLAMNQELQEDDKMQPSQQQRVLQRGSTSKGGSSNQQPQTPHPNKMSKKQLKIAQAQLDKLTQINTHLHALFSAVEHGHLDKARTILESTDVDVNSINADGLSPLDVAVLSNNRSMTKMLLQHGAIEGSQFATESLGNKLNGLLQDAESRIQDLSGCEGFPQQSAAFSSTRSSISSIIIGEFCNSGPSVTGCTGTETDKQIGIWERRVKGLRRMLLGWDQARPPDCPMAVGVDVTGVNSIMVRILEPTEGAIGTKFKVQWSTRADFSNVVGEREILEWNSFQGTMGANCRITDLTQGRRYFIRASCGNVKGWGPSKLSVPASVVPSSWRDLTDRDDRFMGRLRILDSLFTAVRLARPEDASELTLESSAAHRRNPKKKTTIKQLFSVTSKFQKHLRRGIYLACILYYEDKVLVTSEDCIPVIEIDETYPSSLHSDYHWFMKVACTWDDVKSLRTDMERHLTSAVHFRTKLLSAACQMQSALCLTDLGQLYHKPLRDSHGTVVLCCVNSVKTQKSISVLNSRWLPVNKIQKKITALHEDYNINEMLISSISDQILYHQTSTTKINPGLYLGYLKMQCSVDQIQVVVPVKTPNVLPHAKVRDNSHITADEWEILTKQTKSDAIPLEFNPNPEVMTEVQRIFLHDITTAANTLFKHMNIRLEEALNYRLYDIEIIELSKDVSFLIICPPVESSCAVPGQTELLLQRDDLLSLTIQAFEMIHLRTYQNGIIQKYSRLSCILELDTALANHSHREAFSTSELQIAKERLAKLQELTLNLNSVWKSVRWLMDVIAFARDRSCNPTVTIREILDFKKMVEDNVENSMCDNSNCHLLQLPVREAKFSKSGPGRGSWPGPAANSHLNSDCYLAGEHSKSEQNLGSVQPQQFLHPKMTSKNDESLRKNSADSTCSQYTQSYYSTGGENSEMVLYRMPPSRSEDTLSANKQLKNSHFRKRTTVPNVQGGPTSNSAPYLSVSAHSSSCQTNITDSVQSLSSDSETASYPIAQRVKLKTTAALKDGGLFLKSTLNALQTEIKGSDAKVHSSEPSSPVSNKSNKRPIPRQASAEDCTLGNSTTTTTGAATGSVSNAATSTTQQTGIIQVYTAYDTGLASGTSLKLNVTPKTTAREVINLVVKQINMAAVLKAVIGARERCLRDDFKPLQLQNPWKKGRLYVRQKHELLAAIEHSNRKSHLI